MTRKRKTTPQINEEKAQVTELVRTFSELGLAASELRANCDMGNPIFARSVNKLDEQMALVKVAITRTEEAIAKDDEPEETTKTKPEDDDE